MMKYDQYKMLEKKPHLMTKRQISIRIPRKTIIANSNIAAEDNSNLPLALLGHVR